MINDERIDLTERRDFLGPSSIFLGTPSIELADFINRAYDDDNISNDEYDALVRHESIFGCRRHFNEKHDVFKKADEAYLEEMHTHCFRCGKEIRLPWAKRHDLCPECDEAMRNKIPWDKKDQLVSFGNDSAMDMFNLR